jgi:hypothetical protein
VGANSIENKKTSILKAQIDHSQNSVIKLPEIKARLVAVK